MMSIGEYEKLYKKYNLICVYKTWIADTETPVTLYQKMKPLEPVYLLESVEGNKNVARYSFIGLKPFAVVKGNSNSVTVEYEDKTMHFDQKPLDVLEEELLKFKSPSLKELPYFYGGAVGYIAYDVVSTLEKLPSLAVKDLDLPDIFFVFCSIILVFDHVKHTLTAVVNSRRESTLAENYKKAKYMLDEVESLLFSGNLDNSKEAFEYSDVKSSFSKDEFVKAVNKAKEYIMAGDIFQVVLSQRFECNYNGNAFNVYRRLRSLNPSPYMYFLDLGDIKIAGASPEMLVRAENNIVQTHPIAGTRPRGRDEAEDKHLEKELLSDEKERAEHVMLVDLGRNDIGRVCVPGSVKVDSYMKIERYSHVMHIVSNVKGKLQEGKTAFDALKACFPAGTLSGAPKIRAMEIIDELESVKRGVYGGAIGYFGYNGSMDTAIAIRTVVFYKGKAYFQAGAGVVFDSNPESEYYECINKASAVARALGIEDLKGVLK